MWTVLLVLLSAHVANTALHSLQYYYTAVTSGIDFPEYTVVAMVDEKQFVYYDNKIYQMIPKTDWIKNNVGEDYWKRENQIHNSNQENFKQNLGIAMQRFNHTKGVHAFQLMYGCELNDDGTKRGYFQCGYDGEDFLSLDKSSLTWTAANDKAVVTKVKLDSTGADAKFQTNYLENTCIEWLNKYVGYGKDALERKVSPQVSLLQKSPSSPVTCHATGFYPSGVKISWHREGQEHDEDVDLGELIINEDGTFQRASTLDVKPEEWKKNEYKCVVEHQGKTFREILTEDKIKTNYASVPIGIIVGVVAVVLLLVIIAVAGFMVYQKKKGFKPVASDDGSNSSTHSNQKP